MSESDVLLLRPADARALLVLAHGAGAGMRHPFMQHVAEDLAAEGIATLRYQFPYMDAGGGRPDPPAVAEAAVCVAVGKARALAPDLPLFAGGKSFGGRMTSSAQAHAPLEGVRGLVFFGFPLHPAGRPATARAAHLERIMVPMLFLQGTRDALAVLDLMRPVCDHLGGRATLHVVDGADHSFAVLKRSGRTNAEVLRELAATVSAWTTRIADSG
jgi:predicted alpha/beta-hydrolase family hydrolase